MPPLAVTFFGYLLSSFNKFDYTVLNSIFELIFFFLIIMNISFFFSIIFQPVIGIPIRNSELYAIPIDRNHILSV